MQEQVVSRFHSTLQNARERNRYRLAGQPPPYDRSDVDENFSSAWIAFAVFP